MTARSQSRVPEVHTPNPLSAGQPPIALELVAATRDRPLAIYAGAGLSHASPTNIPAGTQLARLCHNRFLDILQPDPIACNDPTSLTSVCDAAAAIAGADFVRRTAIAVADFTSAQPNFSHQILSLLLLEGAVVVITTNWDDCIERAAGAERVLAIISDQDHREVERPALLKVHGCSTRPATLRITTQDLAAPPLWATAEVNLRLAASHTVFLGIGDVPPHVRGRIEEATRAVGTAGAIFVVSPNIDSGWDNSHWADILPDLAVNRRIALTSDEFLDHLAAAYVRRTLRDIAEALRDVPPAVGAFNKTRHAFDVQTSIAALRWLRRCSIPLSPGASVTHQQAFSRALIALGILAGSGEVVFEPQPGWARAANIQYEVLVATGTVAATRFQSEAAARLQHYRSAGQPLATLPTFLIAGAVGRLDGPQNLPTDVLDESESQDLIAGPLVVNPTFVHAEDNQP